VNVSRPMRILLVDDNEELLFSLCRTFRNAGYEVSSAADAESALAGLERSVPDVVLTDLRLPGLSGLDILRAVRQRYPRVPVLIVTAFGDEDTQLEAQRLGAYAMLTKPVYREELLRTVSRALAPAA
jgi:DNA-binding NtrC family response regulator